MQIIEYLKEIENLELYLMVVLFFFTLWFMWNTIQFFYAQKRKIKNLHRFAKEGEAEAQVDLAHHYHKGNIVKKNRDRAAFWYQKAALTGDEEAKGYLQSFLKNSRNKKKKKC